jgi:hypothetical protein
MTLLFIAVSIIHFLARGLAKGVEMIQPRDAMYETGDDIGPRSHIWFGAYHWFDRIRDGALTAAVYWVVPAAVPGVLLLGWGLTELTYSVSRYATLWPIQENVLGTGIIVRGQLLTGLYFIRLVGGSILLILMH